MSSRRCLYVPSRTRGIENKQTIYRREREFIIIIIIINIIIIFHMCMGYLQLYAWNNASRAYNAVTILWFKFMVHVMLFPMIESLLFPISTFRNMCAMPSAAILCSSLISVFPGMLDILWMILRWLQLLLLLLVSHLVIITIIFLI